MWPERRISEPCSKSCGKLALPVESGVDFVRDWRVTSSRVAKVSWHFSTRRTVGCAFFFETALLCALVGLCLKRWAGWLSESGVPLLCTPLFYDF